MQGLHGHVLEAHIEMRPSSFLCNNRLAEHGLVVIMMMTMTLDLRFATLVQDLTVKALDLRMTVVVMIVLDLRLATVIRDLHTALDLHQEFIIPLPQVLDLLLSHQQFAEGPTDTTPPLTCRTPSPSISIIQPETQETRTTPSSSSRQRRKNIRRGYMTRIATAATLVGVYQLIRTISVCFKNILA
jgi:hypothetical protein